MKLDVEGREDGILLDLIMSGAIKHLHSVLVDYPFITDVSKDGWIWMDTHMMEVKRSIVL